MVVRAHQFRSALDVLGSVSGSAGRTRLRIDLLCDFRGSVFRLFVVVLWHVVFGGLFAWKIRTQTQRFDGGRVEPVCGRPTARPNRAAAAKRTYLMQTWLMQEMFVVLGERQNEIYQPGN